MILSVSRRTDIPAFYSDWFFNRLREGYVLVKNPMNAKQISKVILTPETIDCIVFWTKDPTPMIHRLDEIKNYPYYFQFTLNSYDLSLELNVPKKKHLIDAFIALSNKIGKERVIWRYDPILLTDSFDKEYHFKWFEYLASRLSDYTNKCVISFLDLYRKTKRNLKAIPLLSIQLEDMNDIASNISKIAASYNLAIESCSEEIDLQRFNIKHGRCIDPKLISDILKIKIDVDKDPNQRLECGCVKSIDIGEYNTCNHECLYCYANFSKGTVQKNVALHDNNSPLLIGNLNGDERIYEREMIFYKKSQISLFDY